MFLSFTKKLLTLSVIAAFVMMAMPEQSRADMDIPRLLIVTVGSAVACGVVANSVSKEEDKSENTTNAALFCGSIGAVAFAMSDNSSVYGQQLQPQEKAPFQLSLLLREDKVGAGVKVDF